MRYFTLAEAQRLLPEIEGYLRDALFHKAEYAKANEMLDKVRDRVRISGGARMNPSEMATIKTQRDTSVSALKNALEKIEESGVLVKDLDIGLLDFMTRYRNKNACLCWKLGEDAIRFWHGEEEGFRGRKPIDDEFRAEHRGDLPH